MADAITVRLEDAEARILLDGQHLLFDGGQWDLSLSSGVGVDNVTYTGMLLPLPFSAEWQCRGDSDNARLRMSGYTIAGGTASWYELEPGFSGNYYLCSRGTVSGSAIVYTTQSFERNRGVYLSWFTPAAAVEQGTAIEFGWLGPGQSVSCRVLNNGDVEVWDGAAQVLTGNVRLPNAYPGTIGPQGATTGAAAAQSSNRYNDLLAIPCRGRELLLLSKTWGGGFNVALERIAPDAVDPTITEPGPLWWQVPSGQAIVQMAPMRYATAGTIYSAAQMMRFAPGTVGGSVTMYSGTPGYGTVSVAGTIVTAGGSAWGTADTVARCRVTLAGNGIASPWVYGARADWDATLGTVPAAPLVATVLTRQQARLTVDETPGEVRLEFGVAYPETLEGSALPLARTLSNRPVQLQLGGTTIWRGRTEAPRWQEACSDEARTLTLTARDYWAVLERYRMAEPTPLDGLNLGSAVASLVQMAGFGTAQLDIGSVDFTLPRSDSESRGEWALIPKVGDTPAEWLTRIHEDYAATYMMGWAPSATGPVFRFKSPDAMGSASVGTVRLTVGTLDASNVARSIDTQTLPPEANDIWVVGADPRTRRPIVSHRADIDSQDPELAGTARPANWLGEPVKFGWVNPAIQTQGVANWCADILYERLAVEREIIEFEADLLIRPDGLPVWRGDVVTVGTADYRVRSLESVFDLEVGGTVTGFGSGGVWRPTRYIAEKLR